MAGGATDLQIIHKSQASLCLDKHADILRWYTFALHQGSAAIQVYDRVSKGDYGRQLAFSSDLLVLLHFGKKIPSGCWQVMDGCVMQARQGIWPGVGRL